MKSNLDKLREEIEEEIGNLENIKKSVSKSIWSNSDEKKALDFAIVRLKQHNEDRQAILKDWLKIRNEIYKELEKPIKEQLDYVALKVWLVGKIDEVEQLLRGADDEEI